MTYEPVVTKFQVRVLFAQSGRIGVFSFNSYAEAFRAFQDVLSAWEAYIKVAVCTVNGISVIETDEIALVSLLSL